MSAAVASLGMYDHPAQRWANAAIWTALADRLHAQGIDAPTRLDQTRSVEAIWRDPRLLLGQCCGYPLVADPALALRVVALPLYTVPDCAPGRHLGRILVRADDAGRDLAAFEGRIAAVNAPMSNTGTNLFRAAIADLSPRGRFFAAVRVTGSHRDSIDAIRTGQADIASIDAVTHAALVRYEPAALAGLRELTVTRSSPSLPFVTAAATPAPVVTALRTALGAVARDPALTHARTALFLAGVVPASIHRYGALRALEREAAARGYPILH